MEFSFRAVSFHDLKKKSLAQFLPLFSEKSGVRFRSYATLCNQASAQNLKIFWICVQNVLALCNTDQLLPLIFVLCAYCMNCQREIEFPRLHTNFAPFIPRTLSPPSLYRVKPLSSAFQMQVGHSKVLRAFCSWR